eukprot:15439086-Alexandrium_andersonii.AAC.2
MSRAGAPPYASIPAQQMQSALVLVLGPHGYFWQPVQVTAWPTQTPARTTPIATPAPSVAPFTPTGPTSSTAASPSLAPFTPTGPTSSTAASPSVAPFTPTGWTSSAPASPPAPSPA